MMLLIFSPLTILSVYTKRVKPNKRHIVDKHTKRKKPRRHKKREVIEEEEEETHRTTLCTPRVIEIGGVIVITTLQVIAVIIAIFAG